MRSLNKVKKNKVDKNGNKQGLWETYYPNGQLETKGYYIDDRKDGIWEKYYSNGYLMYKALCKDGNLIKWL